jgi:predicted transcriptional regulator
VTNVFEIGYLTQKQLEDKLDKLETITILGKNVDIKFLEGEKKLITQRHIWDRAYNILKSLWSSLTSGFARNQLSETEIMDTVKKTVDDIKGTLNIELTVDEKYLQSYLRSCDIRKQMETIQRLRYMTRIFIYRASQLAESGEKYEQLIDEFCEKAKLTDVEKEIMKLLGSAFIEYAKKNRKISIAKNVVKGKIRSGEWNTAQALEYLTKMGMDKDEASGWLEAEVKPRVVSIDKLVSMAEKIPVNVEILKQKMDAEGVPPNEQQLYLPYFVATELSEEMNSLANEYINQFVYGIINEEQLRSKLDELATLKGQAKTMYDVDWINISPRERELMVEKAKLLRDRRTYRPEGSKGLTSLHLVEATEYLPVSTDKLSEKFSIEGYPPDEQRILMNEAFAKEISEEMGRVATELVTDYVNGVIDETGLRKALDDLATLGGAVPKLLGVPWIVLSPVERDMFVNLAKLRRARAKAKK